MTVAAPHRQRLLRTLGVTPYVLRAPAETPQPDPATAVSVPCVLVLPQACDEHSRAMLEAALSTRGGALAGARIEQVVGGQLVHSVPDAGLCLAFGAEAADAVKAAGVDPERVCYLDGPPTLLHADGKRKLWQALGQALREWRGCP